MAGAPADREERRRSERVATLRLSDALSPGILWGFKPPTERDARGAVVLDVSATGVRLLLEPAGPPDPGDYQLRIAAPDAAPGEAPAACRLRLIWTKADGLPGPEAGFVFLEVSSAVLDRLRVGVSQAAVPIRGTLRPA